MKNTNRTRLNTKIRKLKEDLEFCHNMIKENKFGVAEGCLGSMLRDIMLLYGLMLLVQDDVVAKNEKGDS